MWPNRHSGRCGGVQRAQRVEIVEDVGVFVERRAVADLDEIVDDDRPGRQRGEPFAILGRQRVVGPADGAARDGVEAFGAFDARADLVVIAANQRVRRERANAFDDGVGIGAVADEIAEHEDAIVRTVASRPRAPPRTPPGWRGCR